MYLFSFSLSLWIDLCYYIITKSRLYCESLLETVKAGCGELWWRDMYILTGHWTVIFGRMLTTFCQDKRKDGSVQLSLSSLITDQQTYPPALLMARPTFLWLTHSQNTRRLVVAMNHSVLNCCSCELTWLRWRHYLSILFRVYFDKILSCKYTVYCNNDNNI